jgi:hypothetical protein
VTVMNLLVVGTDPSRNLLFVQGSVPGAREGMVTVGSARRKALKDYTPPVIAPADVVIDELEVEAPAAEDAPEATTDVTTEAPADDAAAETESAEADASTEDENKGEAQA